MVSQLTKCCLSLALACAGLGGCSGSSASNPASPVTAETPPADSPSTGTGGNGTATPPPSTGGSTPTGAGSSSPKPTPSLPHHRCAWMNDNIDLGKASFVANADFFDAIHPDWWTLTVAGNVTPTSWADDATVISTARAHSVKLMPLVYGGDDVSAIRAVISSPTAITAHVQALVQLAVSRSYDGIELDYEHLWAASDRPGYTQLVTELAKALHAQGKELSLAVPAIDVDSGQSGYDYAALVAGGADVIHLMAYDFHSISGDHLGPLAPLGWVEAVDARVQSLGIASHFVLGIANYGVGSGWYVNSSDAVTQCGSYATTTDHMATCPLGNYAPGIAPHCTTAKGDLWFEDGASMAQKAQSAKAHGLRGVAYYTLGGEAPGLLTAMRAAYP